MRCKLVTLAAIIFLLLLAGCAERAPLISTPWPEQTFDFSDFHHFEMGVGYTSLYGYNPKPGLEHATIRRTADDAMIFEVTYYLLVKRKIFSRDRIYAITKESDQRLIYPPRYLSEEEKAQVEAAFDHITITGWSGFKQAICDPFSFFIYEWDDQEFSDVLCDRYELTADTIARIHALMESLTQGEPRLQRPPMSSDNKWR